METNHNVIVPSQPVVQVSWCFPVVGERLLSVMSVSVYKRYVRMLACGGAS